MHCESAWDKPISRSRRQALLCLIVMLLPCIGGCRSAVEVPDLKGLYDQVAKQHHVDRNPVVVIPGILGTKLTHGETDQVVWGAFGGSAVDPSKAEGARIFSLPMVEGADLADLRDEVVPAGVLETLEVRLAGLPIELQAYLKILLTVGAGGYRDEDLRTLDYGDGHFTCFQYPYDWRRDNIESAQHLYRFLKEKQDYVAQERKKRYGDSSPVRFDVIAHSMGGLVLRYMLRYGDADLPADGSLPELTWAGAELVERAILVGTPNAGSADALVQLVEGRKFGPFTPRYEPAVIGTLPSLYQLLPRVRHRALLDSSGQSEDFFDLELWRERGWGLLDPDQEGMLAALLPGHPPDARRSIALDHLEKNLKRAAQLHAALDAPAAPPPSTELMLFVGDAEETVAKVRFNDSRRRLDILATAPGDGTVLRSSALMDERLSKPGFTSQLQTPIAWSQVHFLFADHLGLTSAPEFSDNVLYLLLEAPRSPVSRD